VFVRVFTAIPPGVPPTLTVAGRRLHPLTIVPLHLLPSITATVRAPRVVT